MIVVDTSALFAILAKEEDSARLARQLVLSEASLMSAATNVELGTLCVRRLRMDVTAMKAVLTELAIAVHPFDERQADLAVSAYARYGKGSGGPARLNLGDCFSYALARSLDVPLLYKGDDFVHTDIRSAVQP